jgi:hypothetical protein
MMIHTPLILIFSAEFANYFHSILAPRFLGRQFGIEREI